MNILVTGGIGFIGSHTIVELESVSKPLEYYYNNIVISKMCVKYGVEKFVFSSSTTVYGDKSRL